MVKDVLVILMVVDFLELVIVVFLLMCWYC